MDLPEDMRRKNRSIIDTTNRQMIVRQQNVIEKKVKKKKRESKRERSKEKTF
jgi:fructose-specific phosphotransferase system component IIB